MKMHTVRNILMPQEQSCTDLPQTAVRSLLPPITAIGLPLSVPVPVERPKLEDPATKRAGELYLTMMAGMGFRTQLK